MLWNLIKYDLKFIYKQLVIFYIIILVCAIVARLTNFDNSPFWLRFIHEFTQGAALGFSFGALINATIRTWSRFRTSLYGDESYLTHTLPISKGTLCASKFFTSLIIMTLSIIVIILAISILALTPDTLTAIRHAEAEYHFNFWLCAITFIIALILQLTFIMQAGFTGILLGHRHDQHRLLLSNIFGFVVYLLGGKIIIIICMLWTAIDPRMAQVIIYGNINDVSTFIQLLVGMSVYYIAIIGATYLVDYQLLKRGVNVD